MHTKETRTFGHKGGDVEPIIAGGVVIAEVIPTDCSETEEADFDDSESCAGDLAEAA